MRKENGITMVSLIITIIVMLILASVTVHVVTGEGIIEKAKDAITEYQLHILKDELKIYHGKRELKSKDEDYNPKGLYAYYDKIVYLPDIYTADVDESKNIYDILDSLKGSGFDGDVWIKEGEIVFEEPEYSTTNISGELTLVGSPKPDEDKVDVLVLYDKKLEEGNELQCKINNGEYETRAEYAQDALPPSTTVPVTKTMINNTLDGTVIVYARIYDTINNNEVVSKKLYLTIPTPPTINIDATENSLTVLADGSTDSNGLGIKGYRYSIDNGATWSEVINEGTTYTYDGLKSNETKSISAKAVNKVGFESEPSSKTGTTKAVAGVTITPDIPNWDMPNGRWTSRNVSLELSYNGENNELPDGYAIEYTTDNEANWNLYTDKIIVENNNTNVKARVTNKSIGDDGDKTEYTVKNIDKNPPTAPVYAITEIKSDSLTINRTTDSTDSESGLDGYKYSTDGLAWSQVIKPNDASDPSYTFDNLPAGETQNLRVRAVDNVEWETEIELVESTTVASKINFIENLDQDVQNMPNEQDKIQGEDLILSSQIPTTTGYTFTGWSTDPTSVAEYTAEALINGQAIITEEGDKYLYAIWQPNTLDITLNNITATTPGTEHIYSKYRESGTYLDNTCTQVMTTYENPISIPTRVGDGFDGYNIFDGYYTQEFGQGDKMIDINNEDSNYYATENLINASYRENQTLYANWLINKYNINNLIEVWVDNVKYTDGYNGRVEPQVLVKVDDEYVPVEDTLYEYGTEWKIEQLIVDGITIPYLATGSLNETNNVIRIDLYTVRFSSNNASLGTVSPQELLVLPNATFEASEDSITFADGRIVDCVLMPAETGYINSFSNWTDLSDNLITSGTIITTTDIRANFTRTVKTITIKFYENFGEKAETLDEVVEEISIDYITYSNNYDLGDILKYPEGLENEAHTGYIVNSGYTLVNWNEARNGMGESYNCGDVIEKEWIDSKSPEISLYGQWEVNTLTINLYPNGGSITEEALSNSDINWQIVDEDEHAYVQEVISYNDEDIDDFQPWDVTYLFEKTGYHITETEEWTGRGILTFNSQETINPSNFDYKALISNYSRVINLYANWQENTGIINYYSNGALSADGKTIDEDGKSSETTQIKYTDGTKDISDVTELFTTKAYSYLRTNREWILDPSGSQNASNYKSQNSFDVTAFLADQTNVEINLYANWQDKKLFVNYYICSPNIDSDYYCLVSDITMNSEMYSNSTQRLVYYGGQTPVVDRLVQGETVDLVNYSDIGATRDGYMVPEGAEWTTESGTKFSDSKSDYTYEELVQYADDGTSSYDLYLILNWQEKKPIKVYYYTNGGTLGNTTNYGYSVEATGIINIRETGNGADTFYYGDNITLRSYGSSDMNITKHGYVANSWQSSKNYGFFNPGQVTFSRYKNNLEDGGDCYYLRLQVYWNPITYYIQYNSNGGDGTSLSKDCTYDKEYEFDENPYTKSGYTFAGWSKYQNSNVVHYKPGEKFKNLMDDTSITSGGGNYFIYAVWVSNDEYYSNTTITYYDASTSTALGSSTHTYGSNPNKLTAISTLTSAPTGYTFAGWSTQPNNHTPEYTDQNDASDVIHARVSKLYAVWKKNVTFQSGPAGNTKNTGVMYYNKRNGKYYLPAQNITSITGWTSLGWRDDNTAGPKEYNGGTAISTTNNLLNISIFYAVYNRDVSFYSSNNGSNEEKVKQYYNAYGGKYSVTAPTPADCSDTSWNPIGWRKDNTITTQEYTAGQTITENASKYYAVYSRIATFYSGKNKETTGTATQYYNCRGNEDGTAGAFLISSTPNATSINSWEFLGWRTVTTASDYVFNAPITSSSKTYYATYRRTVNVAYSSNGGTGTMTNSTADQYYNTNGAITTPSLTLKNNGFTAPAGGIFDGWDDNGITYSAGDSYTFNQGVSSGSTKTLKALWKIKTTVTFYKNDGTNASFTREYTTGGNNKFDTNSYSRTGYTLDGWAWSSDASSRSYSATAKVEDSWIKSHVSDNNGTGPKLYAFWKPNVYKVTLNKNGGSGGTSEIYEKYGISYYLDSATSKGMLQNNNPITKPTKSDITVTYDYKNSGITSMTDNSTSSSSATQTFAGYKNADGTLYITSSGYIAAGVDTTYYKDNNGTLTANWTKGSVTLPKPSSTSHNFKGWYSDSACSDNKKVGEGGKSYTPSSNITLYAKWEKKTYTVKYNQNTTDTVTNVPSNQTKTYGVNLTLSSNTPTRTGYNFNGWNTQKDGSGTNYSKGASYTANASVTLYAKWTAKTYIVTYNQNATATVTNMPDEQTKTYGKDLTLNSKKPTRTGYTFNGWNTNAGGTGTSYSAGAKYTDNAAATLYAQWTPITYYVQYKANDGSNNTKTVTHTYDQEKNLESGGIFSRTNYGIFNWNTEANGSGKTYTLQQNVVNLTSTDGATIILYANWKAVYTIKYDSNFINADGKREYVYQTKFVDIEYNLDSISSLFSRPGYKFACWISDSGIRYGDEEKIKNLTTKPGGIVILQAQWSKNQ